MAVTHHRKVIKIRAVDSPNVRYALAERAAGLPISNTVLVPGVLTWEEYQHRRATWETIRQCIGLDAEFWMGGQLLLFPPDWLNHAEQLASELLVSRRPRQAKAIGIDPAEGGDKTAMCAIDEYGVIEIVSRKTPNTNDIPKEAIGFMRKHQVPPSNVVFDRGGGGYQHCCTLQAQGYPVRSVGFGKSLVSEPKQGKRQFRERKEATEEGYVYLNRRVEMYWELSQLMDPTRLIVTPDTSAINRNERPSLNSQGGVFAQANSTNRLSAMLLKPTGFALPVAFREVHCEKHKGSCLRAQLAVMPRLYDKEGRCRMLAKNPPPGSDNKKTNREKCLTELIGHSPDESDALVLAVHALLHKPVRSTAGMPT